MERSAIAQNGGWGFFELWLTWLKMENSERNVLCEGLHKLNRGYLAEKLLD